MPETVYALHGFLGCADDWRLLQPAGKDFRPVNIADPRWWNPSVSFETWADRFNASVQDEGGADNILLGYSLGGRLALAAWNRKPALWKRLVLVSTHPGLKTQDERARRIQSDAAWIERFQTLPWKDFLERWRGQPVFGPPPQEILPIDPPSLEEVSHHLTHFSLGSQPDYRERISRSETAMVWIAGRSDEKFARLAQEMSRIGSHSRSLIVPKVFHRIPWDQPSLWPGIFQEAVT